MICQLSGLRIVVTRAEHQAEELAAPLRRLGATPILLPVIAIGPPIDSQPLRHAAEHCNEYDWIVFTSVNAVTAFAAELSDDGLLGKKTRVASIGAATGDAAEAYGFPVHVMPDKYIAEALVSALQGQRLQGRRILIPSAAVTRDLLPTELRKLGAVVDVVEAYRNVVPPNAPALVASTFREPLPDWVTFASSSAVNHLVELAGAELLRRIRIATIGPVTSATVRSHSLLVTAEASLQSVEGLVDALCQSVHS